MIFNLNNKKQLFDSLWLKLLGDVRWLLFGIDGYGGPVGKSRHFNPLPFLPCTSPAQIIF